MEASNGSKLSKLVGRNTHYLCQESFLYRNNLIWVSLFDSFGIGNRELTSEEVVFNHCIPIAAKMNTTMDIHV
ncbi:hypothetical protein Gasu2_07840 [Galdieria sulphuraria]|nr:hypothetical protein Gasu2_07840 [Galdieria sulphuraria]